MYGRPGDNLQPLLPEEIVRRDLLCRMVHELSYPKSLLSVEMDLGSIPHLRGREDLPRRRADIICFGKDLNSSWELYPLLMVECKAGGLIGAIEQVKGYNYYVNSYFLAVANGKEMKTFWYDERKRDYEFVNFLPSYEQLLKAVGGR